jgi:DNA-binding transcriptional MocR family regulator
LNYNLPFLLSPTIGTHNFREQLAGFLSKNYDSPVNSADIVLSGGASSGLLLILSTLLDMNGVVFVDEVTYMIVLEAIAQFPTLKIVPVKLNNDGVDVEDLERKILQHKFTPTHGKMFFGLYYTIPTYHNPTGILFSDQVCNALISLARKHDFLIVCDDVYNMLHYDDEKSPKRLFAYDKDDDVNFKGHVISNGTFSKILAPGTRVGWLECPPRITEEFKKNGKID